MDWTPAVIDYLSQNLPPEWEAGGTVLVGWDHMFATAYQIGCEALVALGQAERHSRGATLLKSPELPATLPRWDDICVAVLFLAAEQRKLDYRLADGSVPPPRTSPSWRQGNSPPPLPAANITPAHGLGAAYGTADTLSVLERLGLIDGGKWTGAAETVLWRERPAVWALQIDTDPRFRNAVERACMTVPKDVRAEMDRLATIRRADVVEWRNEMSERFGRTNDLDWIFFRRWRLDDGWLTGETASSALEIFSDALAVSMRRAVVPRLYPDAAFLHGN